MFISEEIIRIVHLVAKYQSISVAAGQVNKVPSAISYTLKKVEESLGTELFIRKGRYLALTPSGEYFIQHSITILQDIDALKRNTTLIYTGVEKMLTIAVNNIIPRSALIEFIVHFERIFPSTELTINTEVYNGCWDALYNKRADLVIGAPHAVPSSEGIISKSVGQIEWDFVVGPHHPLAMKLQPLENRELRQYPAVCIRDTAIHFNPLQAWLLEGQKALFVPDFECAIEVIQKNIGLGYIPHHMVKALLNNGRLLKKPIQEHKHTTRLFIATRNEGLGEAARWSMDYLQRPEMKLALIGS